MTTPPSSFPDVEALFVDILRNDPGLDPATVTVDVYPPAGFDGTQQAVFVNRRGGAWVGDLHVDDPLIELEVYGPDKATAHSLANEARRAMLATIGNTYGNNTVTDIAEQDGPRWMPDYLYSAARRYLCVFKVSLNVF